MTTIIHRSRFSRILASCPRVSCSDSDRSPPRLRRADHARRRAAVDVRTSPSRTSCMTVDDSTSMLFDFLPDYVVEAYCRDKYCRDRTASMSYDLRRLRIGGTNIDLTTSGLASTRRPATSSSSTTTRSRRTTRRFDPERPGRRAATRRFRRSAGDLPASTPAPARLGALPSIRLRVNRRRPGSAYEYWTNCGPRRCTTTRSTTCTTTRRSPTTRPVRRRQRLPVDERRQHHQLDARSRSIRGHRRS